MGVDGVDGGEPGGDLGDDGDVLAGGHGGGAGGAELLLVDGGEFGAVLAQILDAVDEAVGEVAGGAVPVELGDDDGHDRDGRDRTGHHAQHVPAERPRYRAGRGRPVEGDGLGERRCPGRARGERAARRGGGRARWRGGEARGRRGRGASARVRRRGRGPDHRVRRVVQRSGCPRGRGRGRARDRLDLVGDAEPQGAEGDREFGLLGDGGGDAEAGVEAGGDEGHAAGAADEEERGEFAGGESGAFDGAAGLVDGAGDERVGEGLEFVAGEVQAHRVVAGEGDGGGGGAREHLFRGAHLAPEGEAVAQVGGGLGIREPLPQFGVASGDDAAEVGGEGHVDVEAAEVVEAADGEGAEASGVVVLAADHGHVEGAAAEVEDGDGAAARDVLAEDLGAVGGGGDGFGEEADAAEPGEDGGAFEDGAADRAPVGGVGQDGLGGALPGGGGGFGDAAQAGGEEFFDRDFAVAEEDGAVVDAALGVRFEARGFGGGEPLGVAAGVEFPAGVEVDAGGEQRRAVEEQGAGFGAFAADHGDGVGGAEVDGEPYGGLQAGPVHGR
ncbi:hypothetical protein QWI33_27380 [Glycomyces tritici]|uniref:Uncharacterized protein n=1 Tax=Glycomyces tritici TaxID=2665176 RepID=A0ABT7YY03_9ACTN|nr:hypothetical protein [Glycomyces tritici]MDN3243467.1 hypothetical protein [Glycomyces tritici]